MKVGVSRPRIILEKIGRNTAPALTLAALAACEGGSDPILLSMPADHAISNVVELHAAIAKALPGAVGGAMMTFGIEPDRAETGYGYIKRGAQLSPGAFHVENFAEKPDLATARRYLECGEYLWNSGIFMVRASVWLNAIGYCQSRILEACSAAMEQAVRDLDFVRPSPVIFATSPSDSIDYAVMERLPECPELGIPTCVVPMNAGWSDVGAWDALWALMDHDNNGNAIVGEALTHESTDSLVFSSSRFVAGVGLKNMIVVETPDAVLVVDKGHTQSIKDVVTSLRAKGYMLADMHRKMHRPWGWYDSIDSGERFQVKRIVVNPGASLSLQMHHHRAEHWVVVKGTAQITNGEKTFLLSENESTYIPPGHLHRLANPGKISLEIIEVQSGSYLGEDDIVRFKDDYGR